MIVALLVAQATAGLTLHVEITQLRSESGHVLVALYDNAASFPSKRDKAIRTDMVVIKAHVATTDFSGLPPGEYAIAVIHDENDNKKLDTNFLGMPTEGVGASNDAKGFMGPPKYEAAKFQLTIDKQKAIIRMHYL